MWAIDVVGNMDGYCKLFDSDWVSLLVCFHLEGKCAW